MCAATVLSAFVCSQDSTSAMAAPVAAWSSFVRVVSKVLQKNDLKLGRIFFCTRESFVRQGRVLTPQHNKPMFKLVTGVGPLTRNGKLTQQTVGVMQGGTTSTFVVNEV